MDYNLDAKRQVEWWTGGYASDPTVQMGGDILVEPTTRELQTVLYEKRLV
jgi:mycoredoxin